MQAVCIAACYPGQWPLLIICPSSMRLVWYDALLNWLPIGLVPQDLHNLCVIANGKVSPHTLLLPVSASCICLLLHLPPASAACICLLHLAACICLPHLPPASASCTCLLHLPPASASCICRLHLPPASAACICPPASASCICLLHLPPAPASCTCLLQQTLLICVLSVYYEEQK